MKYTTLKKLREHGACENRYEYLVKHGKFTERSRISLIKILEINGIDDAIWALRTVKGIDKQARLFACDCAERVLPIFEKRYPNDKRPRLAIDAARKYAKKPTEKNRNMMAAARAAAVAAAMDAARAAARDAARAAAVAAAGDAARAAAVAAAGDAAWAAARAAARDAAWDAARAAARAAARDAARAAAVAAAGDAAWAAAMDAERKEQEQLFIKYFGR